MLALLWACSESATGTVADTEKGFREIPSDVQLAVYWYWISDNISEEGMIRDLEAMKKVGITRAFIGNIGLSGGNGVPFGKVKVRSEAWWKILHTALKTASDLDIEIGIFNSPGWSQSGGQWIKPEHSMRYLASEAYFSAGKGVWKPQGEMAVKSDQEVKVIAWEKRSAPPSDFKATQVDQSGQQLAQQVDRGESVARKRAHDLGSRTAPRPERSPANFGIAGAGQGISVSLLMG